MGQMGTWKRGVIGVERYFRPPISKATSHFVVKCPFVQWYVNFYKIRAF